MESQSQNPELWINPENFHPCIHCLTLCPLGNVHAFCRLLIFFKIYFLKKFFQEYHLSVRLDPDQARHFSALIWVQTVCKSYQQSTLGDKGLHRGSCIIELKELRKRDKMRGYAELLIFLATSLINSII